MVDEERMRLVGDFSVVGISAVRSVQCLTLFVGWKEHLPKTLILLSPKKPLPSNRHHWSNDDCLEGKRENYQVCSVQYCSQQLCTVQCSWRYPELGWLLLATELSVLLDRGYGTVCHAMSLSVRLSLLFVENSNISFLVCLSLDIDCFLFLSRGPWGFYLGHVKNLYTIHMNNQTVLWIGFCLTGPISLCLDSFMYICIACMCRIVRWWGGPGGIKAYL